jgi:hypothetical protein
MVVMVYFQTFSMTKAFPAYMKWFIEGSFVKNYHMAFTINFAALLLLGLTLFGLVSFVSSRHSEESLIRNFASFGYGLIPLGLAGHLAHNLFHLIKEGKSAVQTVLVQSIVLMDPLKMQASSHNAMTGGDNFIKAAQMTVVVLGLLGSFVVLIRSRGSVGSNPHFKWGRMLPHMVFVAVLGVMFLHQFLLPMNARHFH